MPTLRHDIVARFPPRTRFGSKGDAVEIISLHGHVFIVEGTGPDKLRFSTIADDLDDIPEEMLKRAKEAEGSMRNPVGLSRNVVEGREPTKSVMKKRKSVSAQAPPLLTQNQGSLFAQ